MMRGITLLPLVLAIVGALGCPPVASADALDKANAAVANILFEYDGSSEYASYVVGNNGFVEITFASNVPDALYAGILRKLENDPDIKGVLPGKGGPRCDRF